MAELIADLWYGQAGRFLLFLDLYLPSESGRPLIIYIHGGGGWMRGDKALREEPFLAQHYAVASINYRLSTQATFPAQLYDCKAAVRWLRANADTYGYNGESIGAWGYSAGGLLAGLLGATADRSELEGDCGTPNVSSAVQSVVCVAAPSNLATLGGWHNEASSRASRLIGAAVGENPALAEAASPVAYVNNHTAPTCLIHGVDDEEIPFAQSQEFHAALGAAGIPTELVAVNDAGHSFPPASPQLHLVENTLRNWYAKTLKPLQRSS